MPNLPDYDPGFTPELEDEDLRDIAAADRRCGPDDMLAWLQTFLAAEKRWPSLGEVRKQFGGLIGPFVACWRLKDRGDFDRLYEVVPRKTHHWQTIWLKDPYRGDDPTLDPRGPGGQEPENARVVALLGRHPRAVRLALGEVVIAVAVLAGGNRGEDQPSSEASCQPDQDPGSPSDPPRAGRGAGVGQPPLPEGRMLVLHRREVAVHRDQS